MHIQPYIQTNFPEIYHLAVFVSKGRFFLLFLSNNANCLNLNFISYLCFSDILNKILDDLEIVFPLLLAFIKISQLCLFIQVFHQENNLQDMLVVIGSKHDQVCRYGTTRNGYLMLVVTDSCGPLQCYENELDAYKLNTKKTMATYL